MPFAHAVFTDSYRERSEDRATIVPIVNGVVIVVADGVGGRAGGERAAQLATEYVCAAISTLDTRNARAWHRLAVALDRHLADDTEAGETTLVIAAVTKEPGRKGRVTGVSVGDSEAWWITADGHFDLTGGQQQKPFLGIGMVNPVPFSLPLPAVGTLLVATDGLFKYAPSERIEDVALLPELNEGARRLADLPRLNSGRLPDDIAIALCRFQGDTLTLNEKTASRKLNWYARLRTLFARSKNNA